LFLYGLLLSLMYFSILVNHSFSLFSGFLPLNGNLILKWLNN